MSELTSIFDDINALLERPRAARARVETTLTDGYAHALGLEAERVRIERRIGELARALDANGSGASELAELSRRLTTADGELMRLRTLLATLRAQAYDD